MTKEEHFEAVSQNGSASSVLLKDVLKMIYAGQAQKVTYAELKALRDNDQLVPGTIYRITDYECTTTQEDTQSAGHKFDIIVQALDEHTLSEEAHACINEEYEKQMTYVDDGDHCVCTFDEYDVTDTSGETRKATFFCCYEYEGIAGYFITGTVEDWKNKTALILWADTSEDDNIIDVENKKAVVNGTFDDLWGDIAEPSFGYFTDSHLEAWKLMYSLDNDTKRFIWADEENGKGVIYRMVDEWNNDCPYDFKNIQFKRKVTDGQYDEDGEEMYVYTFNAYDQDNSKYMDAFKAIGHAADDGCCACYSNVIKPLSFDYDRGAESQCYRLNNNVFLNIFSDESQQYFECWGNSFGSNCKDNTFGSNCYTNSLGCCCFNNSFSGSSIGNSFISNCSDNSSEDIIVYEAYATNNKKIVTE